MFKRELGLTGQISQAQIDEMNRHKDDINFELAEAKEKELRHDVMAHACYSILTKKTY